MKKKNLLLVDFNNLLYRSVFAHQGLSHKGKFTGGVYGFIDMVCSTVNRYKCDRLAVCFDSKPYIRSKFYPDYKADRKQVLEEDSVKQLAISRKQINELLARFKIPLAKAPGHEADDLIGEFCRSSNSYKSIFIMSNDSDLYQLLDGRIFLAKTGGLYGLNDFNKDWPKITPQLWPRCVALKGSHNGVPGIHGVGDKTAYRMVAQGVTDKEVWVRWRMRRKDIEVNTALATFPLPLALQPHLPHVVPINYNAKKMEEECERYGIRFRDEFHDAFMRLAT